MPTLPPVPSERTAGLNHPGIGPRPNNMAAADEFITVDDLVAVAKVHLATALDVLHDDTARAR